MLGLTDAEAQKALAVWGYNELPASKDKTVLDIARSVMREPMFLLLVCCGALYMILGDYREGVVLSLAVFLIIAITFFQYKKTARALELLKKLAAPQVLVVRENRELRVPARELVPGDLMLLKEGDRVAADAVLVESSGLFVDESLLSGESFPVNKKNDAPQLVFLGTLVVKGRGLARVEKTGSHTQLGTIGSSLTFIKNKETRLQAEMRSVIRLFFLASVAISIIVVFLFYLRSGRWVDSVLTGLSSSMAILPEEFPVVLSVFLALGAWRLTKNNVLTRHATTVESLGATTVLCTDKTGTLTQNSMQVAALYNGKETLLRKDFVHKLPAFDELLTTAWGASAIKPVDPMELAIGNTRMSWGTSIDDFTSLIKEYPLSDTHLVMTQVWRTTPGNNHIVAAKGAPEAIFNLCRLPAPELSKYQAAANRLGAMGYRVLGVARASSPGADKLPDNQSLFLFRFLGLIAFEDPIRKEVPAAIQDCASAGIRVIIITGDHPETAVSIAKQIGLFAPLTVLTGPELDKIPPESLVDTVRSCSVFARIRPQQKLLLVDALQSCGEVVAMTGDGVNDAPALKKADIGIAMGLRGTDVAREAAGLVLLDDNFASIVAGIRSGRKIYDNLQKAMSYIVAIHIPIIGLVLLPAAFPDFPILLLPVHIVFMELIIDPVCSLAFETAAEEKKIMDRPPRSLESRFFVWKNFWSSCLAGAALFFLVVFIYQFSLNHTPSFATARAVAFFVLIVGNLLLVFSSLSKTKSIYYTLKEKNWNALIISTVAVIALLAAYINPFMRAVFKFARPGFYQLFPGFIGLFLLLGLLEGVKKIKKRG